MYLISRTETFVRLFFLVTFSGLIMYVVLAFYTFHTALISMRISEEKRFEEENKGPDTREINKDNSFKYILLWNTPDFTHNLTDDGQQIFIKNNCSQRKCYLTTNKYLLGNDVRYFDAIVFSINNLKNLTLNKPAKRSIEQQYVFHSMVSANKYPVCDEDVDSFFNWTWSYKLNSDIVTPFFEVRDRSGKLICPRYESDWAVTEEVMDNTEELMSDGNFHLGNRTIKMNTKSKAVMWYMDKCDKSNNTISFARQVKEALKELSLKLDIFGCGFSKCPKLGCYRALNKDYYFYLAQEDSISADYVTKEVLKAYQNNAVPIVVGGADYNKFLPFNSFISVSHDSVDRLPERLQYIISHPPAYEKYFTWKTFLNIQETNLQRGYCDLCNMLNDEDQMEMTKTYKKFREWWFQGSLRDRCSSKRDEIYDDLLSKSRV